MRRDEILKLWPNASESTIRANLSAGDSGQVAKLESNTCDAPLEAKEVQRPVGKRVLVRVTSFRKCLLDEDNLCEKYHVDLCRYAGIIADDTAAKVKIEVCQFKAGKNPETTVVEVFAMER